MNITLDHPAWAYFVCILVGVVFSFALYYRQKYFSSLAKWVFYLLLFLRFSLGFLLAFLLFNPLLNYTKTITEKPVVVVLQDNSSSILANADSLFIKNEFETKLKQELDEISTQFDVKKHLFGTEVLDSLKVDYSSKTTNISAAMHTVADKYYNQNVAAVVLLTDGIYNEGENPLYANQMLNAPIFTVALGDTIPKKDQSIQEVTHNKVAFLGNQFPVNVRTMAQKLNGKNAVLSIKHDGKTIAEQKIAITDDTFLSDYTFLLEAKEVGIQSYKAELSEIKGEYTLANNAQTFYVEVLDSKQKILLLAAAPHPDIAAIRSAIEANKNYEVIYKTIDSYTADNTPYDAIILHSLPAKQNDKLKSVFASKASLFLVLGNQTDFNALASSLPGINLSNSRSFSSASPKLNTAFSLFKVEDDLQNYFNDLPPLSVPFLKEYNINKQHVLAHQKIGNVATNQPLMGFYRLNQRKVAYILGEGLWRWKIHDFKLNKNHKHFNALLSKSIQYLSTKEDKSFFRTYVDKTNFTENETVKIKAEFYNKAYEPVTEPEVKLSIKNSKGEEFSFVFSKQNNAYLASVSGLKPGNYTFTANTEFNGEKFTKEGMFSVQELKQELLNTVANHRLLYQLSTESSGQLIYPKGMEGLSTFFEEKERFPDVLYTKNTTESVINLKWIFGLLIALAGLEWFIRKREGGY